MHVPYLKQCGTSSFLHNTPETCAEDDDPNCPQYAYTPTCVGLVSMAWGSGHGTTPIHRPGLPPVSKEISCDTLQPGDQVATKSTSGKGDAHQYLFRMWTSPNEVKGEFKYYQEGGGHGAANVALMTPDSTLNWCEDLSSEELSRAKFCLACSLPLRR